MIGGCAVIADECNHSRHSIRKIIVPDGEESRTLASLRDGLSLPRVMKGEVRVKDVEA
jgi:hypothetical protein